MSYKKAKRIHKLTSVAVSLLLIAIVCVAYFATGGSFNFDKTEDFDTSQDFVRVIDVGQGDCILIYSNGYSALIDTGTEESVNNVCAELDSCDIESIDVMLISHLHADHTGGIKGISGFFDVSNVVLPELSVSSEGLGSAQYIINKLTKNGGGVFTAEQGMNFKIGEFELTVLASYGDMADENNRSVMVMAENSGKKFLFTGDAEVKAENALLKEGLNLKCDVFKAGHHGSSTSNSEKLLKLIRPRYTVISAGKDNMYGHPHNEVLSDFENIGAEVLRTDRNGDITFYIDNGKITAKTEK